MDLVDEGDDPAVRLLDLLQHALEAFLEFATVFRTGHHGSQVERDELLVLQRRGHVACDDALGEAFDDGGLADAGLADQHRVVLGAAGQDLDDAADLLIASDHRVEFAVLGGGGQVGGILLQRLVGAFRVRTGDLRAAADGRHGLAQRFGGDAVAFQDLGGLVRLRGRDADEQMFGGDVFVAHLLHFLFGLRQRGGQLTADLRLRGGRPADLRQGVLRLVDGCADVLRVAARGFDKPADHSVFLTQQRVHHMYSLDLRIACGGRVLNGVPKGFLRHRGELLFHIILHGSRRNRYHTISGASVVV